jgi:hypothetical protein
VAHELGHLLGLHDTHDDHELMGEALPLSVRRLAAPPTPDPSPGGAASSGAVDSQAPLIDPPVAPAAAQSRPVVLPAPAHLGSPAGVTSLGGPLAMVIVLPGERQAVPFSGPEEASPDLPPGPAVQGPELMGSLTSAGGTSTADGRFSEAALLGGLSRARDRVFADWAEGPFDPPA